jgi:hypothetical protein
VNQAFCILIQPPLYYHVLFLHVLLTVADMFPETNQGTSLIYISNPPEVDEGPSESGNVLLVLLLHGHASAPGTLQQVASWVLSVRTCR